MVFSINLDMMQELPPSIINAQCIAEVEGEGSKFSVFCQDYLRTF